ncbi:MAG: MOSC domain-containing protein [Gemmatimonadales bacterium]
MRGRLLSVNVGRRRQFEYKGRPAESAIWKLPIEGRVLACGVNLQGDEQADRSVHGGHDKAVYAYASEDYDWWSEELGRELEYGEFGENLTTAGLDLTNALVGERWEVGSTVLEVSEARMPCWKLGVRVNDKHFPQHFLAAGRPGAYLRILQEGDIGSGDEIRVVHRPPHDLTVGDLSRIYAGDRHDVGRMLGVPQLSASWQEWARDWIDRHGNGER